MNQKSCLTVRQAGIYEGKNLLPDWTCVKRIGLVLGKVSGYDMPNVVSATGGYALTQYERHSNGTTNAVTNRLSK